eukprot:4908758-Alexandrium_andersonii.AAC.1
MARRAGSCFERGHEVQHRLVPRCREVGRMPSPGQQCGAGRWEILAARVLMDFLEGVRRICAAHPLTFA